MSCVFSIIIPAYNCADTLGRCLTSILSQLYDNMEVLVIDDGSTDSTPEICDEYSSADSRIRVFHKINGGVSSARNVGIDNACGEWLAFVDSDDVLAEHAIVPLLEVVSKQNSDYPDIIVENVLFLYNNRNNGNILYSSKLTSIRLLFEQGFWGSVCNKLFSSRIINEHKIRFDESLHFCEDCLFVAEYCGYVHDVKYINEVCYVQYLPDNYSVKYSRYNLFENNLALYRKIKHVNKNCSSNLVDGLTMSLLRSLAQPYNNASQLIAEFKSAVGSDIQYAKGKKKCFIRALSHIDNVAVWTLVLKLYSRLPI